MPHASQPQVAVVVGSGQLSSRRGGSDSPPGPLELLVEAAVAAAQDAGGSHVLQHIDTVVAVPIQHWQSNNPAAELASALGITASRTVQTTPGGDIGVVALNWMAQEIAAGRSKGALLVGANVNRSFDLAQRRGVELEFAGGSHPEPEIVGKWRSDGSSPQENEVGLDRPVYIYPVIENALRAWRGQSLAEHRRFMGDLFTRFTAVAADNPYAWFPTQRSSEELADPTPDNRIIGFPYTKLLNAILSTDQAAAVVMLGSDTATSARVNPDGWVHWWGGGAATEAAWFVSQRPDLAYCPAMAQSHHAALRNAQVGVDDIAKFDFYSCFPAPVEMALRVMDLDPADSRGYTVTGGLPYAGGPGSAYTVHSLAAMYTQLRRSPHEIGMVTGNGWYLTKHSAAIFSTDPPRAVRPCADTPELDEEGAKQAQPVPIRRGSGSGRIDSYTVAHDRAGQPERGMVVGSFGDGTRFVANTASDADVLAELEAQEMVGRTGKVVDGGGPTLRFDLD